MAKAVMSYTTSWDTILDDSTPLYDLPEHDIPSVGAYLAKPWSVGMIVVCIVVHELIVLNVTAPATRYAVFY
ncbi:hypothetical protein LZ023_20710 [Pseudomonas silvicola]|nr:hypothetical protein LZ023_20710 [Pseudomonas silvicola]